MRKNIIILGVTILLATIIYLWYYPLNKGEVYIQTGVIEYQITIKNKPYNCKNDPCIIKLKTGSYKIKFNKEKYYSSETEAEIRRGKTTAIKIIPKKKSSLEDSEGYKETPKKPTPPLPEKLTKENIKAGTWNKRHTKFVFLDKEDERVKIYKKNKETILVTVLKNIDTPLFFYWSNNEKDLIVSTEKDLYLIEIENGSRKKEILNFFPSKIIWSPDDKSILVNDSNYELYKKEKIGYNDTKQIKYIINLEQSKWIDEERMVSYKINEKGNKTTIFIYNVKTGDEEIVMEKYAFPVSEIKFDAEKKTTYLYHNIQKKWYEIKIS